MKLSVLVKLMGVVGVVALLVGSVGSLLVAREQSKLFDKLYLDKTQALVLSLDASVAEKDLEDPEDLRAGIYKLLLLNPDVLEISIFKSNAGKLEKLVSTGLSDAEHDDNQQNSEAFAGNKSVTHKEIHDGILALDLFAPLHVSGRVAGTYNVVVSLKDLVDSQFKQTRDLMLLMIGAVALFVIGMSSLVKTVISNPLRKLIETTIEVEKGNFDGKIEVKGKDEIGDLAVAFSQMAKKLKHSYSELEKRVQEKTVELSTALKTTQNQNKTLEENKAAMLNLLEDEKELEETLEKRVLGRTKEVVEEKAKLLGSIEAIVRAYVLLDLQGQIILVNKKLTQFLGGVDGDWTLDKLQQKLGSVFDIKKAFANCLKEKNPIYVKEINLGAKFFDLYVAPVFVNETELVDVLILMGDITEEKVLDRSKDEFFSIASHELRTPLTAIRGNTDLILQFYGDQIKDPQFKEMIDDVHESSVRLIDIVNDFLDMSRLEIGKVEFKKENFDMGLIVAETLKEYQVTGSRKKLSLEFVKPKGGAVWAVGDKDRVKQVLVNLIGNGLKFTEEGGVTISLSTEGNMVKVGVEDTGRGIPKENQSLLFRKFQQASSSLFTRDMTKGTGLGLYISKLLVEGMGGKIELVRSEEGKGTVFAFTLPGVDKKIRTS